MPWASKLIRCNPRDNKWLLVVGAVLLLIFWPLVAVIGFALWLQYFRKPGLK